VRSQKPANCRRRDLGWSAKMVLEKIRRSATANCAIPDSWPGTNFLPHTVWRRRRRDGLRRKKPQRRHRHVLLPEPDSQERREFLRHHVEAHPYKQDEAISPATDKTEDSDIQNGLHGTAKLPPPLHACVRRRREGQAKRESAHQGILRFGEYNHGERTKGIAGGPRVESRNPIRAVMLARYAPAVLSTSAVTEWLARVDEPPRGRLGPLETDFLARSH